MKCTPHGTLLVVGTSLAVLTIATPYRNGAWLDPATTIDVAGLSLNLGLGPVMVALHASKLRLVSLVAPAWRRSRVAGTICVVVAAVLVAVSTYNAWALLDRQRSARGAGARYALERADVIRRELRSVRDRVAVLGWRPLATIDAELSAQRHRWAWDATAGCAKVESGPHRKFCADFAKLEGARAEAAQAESLRQREAELARALLDQSPVAEERQAEYTEMLQAILIAVVIELTEVAVIGLAGFFTPISAPASSYSLREEPPVQAAARSSKGGERSRAARKGLRVSSQARSLGATKRGSTEAATSDSDDDVTRCASDTARQRTEAQAPRLGEEERRRAIEGFVASLRHGPNLRVSGSAVYDAYTKMCQPRGWPPIARNVFGQLMKPAVEAVGGFKVKSSHQYYSGVGFPNG